MVKIIDRVYNRVYDVIMVLCKLFLIADVLITSYAVLGRYVGKYIPFITDPAWSEEIVLTCMIYMSFLSAALAIRRQTHIRMTSLDPYLPAKLCQVLDLVADLLITGFAVVMVVIGFRYSITIGSRASYVSLPWLSRFWLYAPVPIAGVAIFLFELEVIAKHILVLIGKDKKGVETV